MSTVHTPRGYQARMKSEFCAGWASGQRFLLGVLPTGGGKTFVFSRIAAATKLAVAAVAHRSELVTQMAMALAREGVRHNVIGSAATKRAAISMQLDEFGRDFTSTTARVTVCSVDTLVNMDPNLPWFKQVGLWIMDEAHHVLKANKWGRACAMFPNAWGLGVTATPIRADGKGLGAHADGLFQAMVLGPTMRELIDLGHLTDYDVVMPTSDLDLSDVTVTDSGDFSPEKLKRARRRSHITGDVVESYLKFAAGKRAVVFDTDVESAGETAAALRAAGVKAQVVSAKTADFLRAKLLREFRSGAIDVLVNVDLFGEGFDLPAIEVVVFARPTQSKALYMQQFGRALRTMGGKTRALIIDHVGNVVRHGLPDKPHVWTLDRREGGSRNAPSDAIPLRPCTNVECLRVYERVLPACPFCGTEPPVLDRSSPTKVDGDLQLVDPAVLAQMRGQIVKNETAPYPPFGATPAIVGRLNRQHGEKMDALAELRSNIALWAGWQHHLKRSDAEAYRRFYHQFGLDVLSAQTLNAADMAALNARVAAVLNDNNVRAAA